jgi:hypothetical protein
MAQYRVAPKSYAGSGGNGSTWTPGASGPMTVKQMADAIAAGTIVASDEILFAGSHGQYTLSDASDWPNAGTAGQAISQGSTNAGGIIFGTSQGTASKASGITFNGMGDGARAYFNMAGATTRTQRQAYALAFRGEGMRIFGFQVRAADWDYIAEVNTAPPGGTNQAETLSWENIGMFIFGNGNTVEDCIIDCYSGVGSLRAMSRYGLGFMLSTEPMGASFGRHLKTIVRRNLITGAFMGLRVDPGGPGSSGSALRSGCTVEVYSNKIMRPVFGRRATDPDQPFNAASHGGHASLAFIAKGSSCFNDNYMAGDCQDACDLICNGLDVCWNVVEDVQAINPTIWTWTGSAWVQAAPVARQGNGLKLGLSGLEGTPPTSWLGTDGTSGSLGVELAQRVVGNKIRRVSSIGITSNASGGHFIAHNEVIDAGTACFATFGISGSNFFLAHNYGRLADSSLSGSGVLDTSTAGVRVTEYNNIWNAGPNAATRNAYDAVYRQGTTGARTGVKNVFVTGRRSYFNSSPTNVFGNDVNAGNAQSINYVEGKGFPSGDVLQGQGSSAWFEECRSANMSRDANKRRIVLPANLGPYSRGY